MFLLSDERQGVHRALQRLRSEIAAHVECGPIQLEDIAGRTLGWFACRPTDNVHRFRDGTLIGALSYAEAIQTDGHVHAGDMPETIDPVWGGVKILDTARLQPVGTPNVYYSSKSVSDMQLLIADLEGHQPGQVGFALLSQLGYFPGNLTLFDQIRRIPFRATLDLGTWSITSAPGIDLPVPNDEAMLSRLVAATPRVDDCFVSLSGGVDSRLVLGCVWKAGIRPRLLHTGAAQYSVAQSIASCLGLELLHSENELAVAPPISQVAPLPHTVMTDAQIIFAAGALSKWRSHFTPRTIVHLGVCGDPILKAAYSAVRRIPGSDRGYYPRLIRRVMLSTVPTTVPLLRHWNRHEDLLHFLVDELADQPEQLSTRNRKAIANWFSYMNRGLRWTSAITAEASFFARPTFILSDYQGTLLGLATGATANWAHARARSLTSRLLPQVATPYADGLPARPAESWRMVPERIGYELFPRAWSHRSDEANLHGSPGPTSISHAHALMTPKSLSAFTTQEPDLIVSDPTVPDRFKRALITLSHVLAYVSRPDGTAP